jgi:hydroxymethylbilane synthase
MPTPPRSFIIATRGSALALAQAHLVAHQCRHTFPNLAFEIKIIKTTGDKQLTASLARPDASLPKGLFTKELELALLNHQADLAVHSLKDLPTELPAGLTLGATSARADVRDVLIYRHHTHSSPALRGFGPGMTLRDLPAGAVLATSSTRRHAQVLEQNPTLKLVEIRGNVATRLHKLASQPDLDATLLAAAGLERLGFVRNSEGCLSGTEVPAGLCTTPLAPEIILPCVGQAALGIEVRTDDPRVAPICLALNDPVTFHCVTAERAFLQAMGGGCQSPVAAYATPVKDRLHLRAVSFRQDPPRRTEDWAPPDEAVALGQRVARRLLLQPGFFTS